MNNSFEKVIIIDDDPCNNLVNKLLITKFFFPSKIDITEFTNPEEGVAFILNNYAKKTLKTVLLLDLNMPLLTGWDVLERLETLPGKVKQLFTVYILSSSIDPADKQRAYLNPMISGYVEKPLAECLTKIFDKPRSLSNPSIDNPADKLLRIEDYSEPL